MASISRDIPWRDVRIASTGRSAVDCRRLGRTRPPRPSVKRRNRISAQHRSRSVSPRRRRTVSGILAGRSRVAFVGVSAGDRLPTSPHTGSWRPLFRRFDPRPEHFKVTGGTFEIVHQTRGASRTQNPGGRHLLSDVEPSDRPCVPTGDLSPRTSRFGTCNCATKGIDERLPFIRGPGHDAGGLQHGNTATARSPIVKCTCGDRRVRARDTAQQ